MKKIVAGAALAALTAGLVFADPVANPSVVTFNGNATAKWGVDLDAGRTGFANETWTEIKMSLFDGGNKATSGEGVWGELKIKTNADYDKAWYAKSNSSSNTATIQGAVVDVAKLHFNNFYVGLQSGDVTTGLLDYATEVRARLYGAGARWLNDVGPTAYTQGIVAGYDDSNLNVAVDFRSDNTNVQYTDAYAVAGEVTLKDSNEWVNGLTVKVGGSYTTTENKYTKGAKDKVVENTIKQTYITADEAKAITGNASATAQSAKGHEAAYSASAAYKYNLDDKYYIKPMVGTTAGVKLVDDADDKFKATVFDSRIVASVLLGWGALNGDASPNLYYFGYNETNGAIPGVSVLGYVPLAKTIDGTSDGKARKYTIHNALVTLIVPSFYSGKIDAIPNLQAAAYSEIGIFNGKKDTVSSDSSYESWGSAADKDNTTAFALAASLAYDIKADDLTITPKAGMRYANATYMDNRSKIEAVVPSAATNGVFHSNMGDQKKKTETGKTDFYDGDFFNLSLGVNVAGLISNTDLFVDYVSANLLNGYEYNKDNGFEKGAYNVKAGTINVGAKVHF